jgi:hypothetical protein
VNSRAQHSGQDIPNANLTAKGKKQTRFFYNSIFKRYVRYAIELLGIFLELGAEVPEVI